MAFDKELATLYGFFYKKAPMGPKTFLNMFV